MRPEEAELIRYRLARARESLDEARLLLDADHVNTSVNRMYYACFYAVSALLLTEGRSSAKHTGTRALFDRYWVKTGHLPVSLGRIYRRFFMRRQRGDYSDLTQFCAVDAERWLDEASEFVAAVVELTESQLPSGAGP